MFRFPPSGADVPGDRHRRARQSCGACGRFMKSRPQGDYRVAAMSSARVIPRVIMYTGSSQRRNPGRIARRDLDDGRLQEGEERSFPAEISLTYAGPAPFRGDSRYPKLLITLHPRRARYRARVSHYHVNIVVRLEG